MPQKTFSVQFVSQGVATVQRQMKGAGKAGKKAGDDIEKAGRKGASSMDNLRDSVQGAATRMKSMGKTLTATLTTSILGLGGAALKSSADMEQQRNALEAVMGSAEAAAQEFELLTEVASNPSIAVKQAIDASTRLQVVGESAEDARNMIEQFGNAVAASGGSADDLDAVISQLTKMISTGRLTEQRLGTIVERAPAVGASLQEAFGATTAEAINENVDSVDEFTERLTASLSEAERVEGGLDNAFNNVKIQVRQSLSAIGDSLNETFEVQELVERFTGFMDDLTQRFVALPEAVQKTSFVVAGLAAVVGPLLIAVGALTAALATVSTPVLAIVGGLSALGAALAASGVGFSDLKDIAISAWEGIKTAVMPLIEALQMAAQALVDRLTAFWERWGKTILSLLSTTWDQISTIVTGALRILGGLLQVFIGFITGDFAGAWDALKGVVVDTFKTVTRVVLNALKSMVEGIQGLAAQIPLIGDALDTGGDKVTSFLEGLKPEFGEAGKDAGDAYADGFTTELQNRLGDASTVDTSTPSTEDAEDAEAAGAAAGAGRQRTDSVSVGASASGGGVGIGTTHIDEDAIRLTRELTEAEQERLVQSSAFLQRQERLSVLSTEMLEQARSQTMALGSAIGDNLTSAIFEGENAFKAMGKTIMSILQDMIQQLIAAVAQALLLNALTGGTASVGGLTGAVGGLIPMASGGIVSGPTAILAGEYSGARANPEVIAPLDKLQSMLPAGGGAAHVTIEPRVLPSGDLTFAQREGDRRRRRTGNA